MKQKVILILLTSLMIAGCSSVASRDEEVIPGSTEGEWINHDIFRIKVTEAPGYNASTKELKRQSAREKALNSARTKTIRFFRISSRGKGHRGITNYADGSIKRLQEMVSIIRSGKIIREKYDSKDNCTILFQVVSWGLKQKVNAIFRGNR